MSLSLNAPMLKTSLVEEYGRKSLQPPSEVQRSHAQEQGAPCVSPWWSVGHNFTRDVMASFAL